MPVGINTIKLRSLEKTKKFYAWVLRYEDLTTSQRDSYLLAKKSIEKIIKEKELSGEKLKHKESISKEG